MAHELRSTRPNADWKPTGDSYGERDQEKPQTCGSKYLWTADGSRERQLAGQNEILWPHGYSFERKTFILSVNTISRESTIQKWKKNEINHRKKTNGHSPYFDISKPRNYSPYSSHFYLRSFLLENKWMSRHLKRKNLLNSKHCALDSYHRDLLFNCFQD